MFQLCCPIVEGGHILSLQILLNSMDDSIVTQIVEPNASGISALETDKGQMVSG